MNQWPSLRRLHLGFLQPTTLEAWRGLQALNLVLVHCTIEPIFLGLLPHATSAVHDQGLLEFMLQQQAKNPDVVLRLVHAPSVPGQRRTGGTRLNGACRFVGRHLANASPYTIWSTGCCLALAVWVVMVTHWIHV